MKVQRRKLNLINRLKEIQTSCDRMQSPCKSHSLFRFPFVFSAQHRVFVFFSLSACAWGGICLAWRLFMSLLAWWLREWTEKGHCRRRRTLWSSEIIRWRYGERERVVLPLSLYSVAARFLHTRAAFRLRCVAILTAQNANSQSIYSLYPTFSHERRASEKSSACAATEENWKIVSFGVVLSGILLCWSAVCLLGGKTYKVLCKALTYSFSFHDKVCFNCPEIRTRHFWAQFMNKPEV